MTTHVTRPGQDEEDEHPPTLRETFTPLVVLTSVIGLAVTALGVVTAANDPEGESLLATFALVGGPAIATVYACLSLLWRPDPRLPTIVVSLLRVIVVPLVLAVPNAVVALVVVLMPPVADAITAGRSPRTGFHYYFSAEDGSPAWIALAYVGLGGLIVALLAGLVVSVFVVLPWLSFRRPSEAARAHQLSMAPEDLPANAGAARALSLILVLAFLVPTLIVVGSETARSDSAQEALLDGWWRFFGEPGSYAGDLAWAVGIALIPVGVALVVWAKIRQRPDVEARAATGTNALDDAIRHRRSRRRGD